MPKASRIAVTCCLVAILLTGAVSMATDVKVQSIGSIDGIGAFDRHEWRIDPAQTYANPFDPEEVAVDATFAAPDGHTLVQPAFWDRRQGTPDGCFVIRFAPDQPGNWSMAVSVKDRSATRAASPIGFGVQASHRRGFIRRAANNRYFQYDNGDSYFAVGINLCWPTGPTRASWYDGAFETLAKNGGNFARVWMAHPPVMLESGDTGLGKYSTDHAAYFDHVLDAADRDGIEVMLCFLNHRDFLGSDMWGKAGWDTNPYNAQNGGPATRPVDVFSNPDAARHFKARLRYIVARYAAYTSVGFWELFNEQENIGFAIPNAWNAEMAAYLRQIDPYKHLITTSASVPPQVWQLPEMDLTQTHIYGDGTVSQTLDSILNAVQQNERFRKPHLIGEMGLDFKGPDITLDPHGLGTAFHNSLWAAALSGNAGTAMYWWWDNYVEPRNLWHELKPISIFTRQIDWAHSDFRPCSIDQLWHENAGDAATDLTLATAGGWGDTNHGPINISDTGKPDATPAFYLYGPQHPELRSPMAFNLKVPPNGALKLGISGVSDCAFVRVSIDDKPVHDFPLSALPGSPDISKPRYRAENKIYQSDVNKEFSLDLPLGHHRVTIDVAAGDWVSLSHVTFTNALPARYANLASASVQDPKSHETLIWILDTRSNWKHDQSDPVLPSQNDVRLIVPHLSGGARADWFDTRAGVPIRSDDVAATDGVLTLTAPAFTRDIAVRVRPNPPPANSQWTEPTDIPTPKVDDDGQPNAEFHQKHQEFLERGRQGDIDLLFLGDSITADWTWGDHPQLFDRYFAKYHPANFGVGGDRTEHVLWRIENGELDGIHPRVVVLLIGTNNIGWSAGDISRGVTKIVSVIHEKLPDTRVLLLGIFPRGADPNDPRVAAMRAKIRQVNATLAKLGDGDKTRFLDIGQKFLSPDGGIDLSVMKDALHPESKGLEIWADAMSPLLAQMMK